MANPLPIVPDQEIVARIRNGDEEAFESMFLQHYNRLCIIATRMMHSEAAAEELVQDVLLRVWEQRQQWDLTSTISGYLAAAVRNHALNRLYREKNERRWRERAKQHSSDVIPLHSQPSTPDDELAVAELLDAMTRAVAELPPRCRQAFLLRRHRELSYAEIARIMQITPKTVEIHIGLALKTLRRRLADWL
jgi:RNA polymerase sigma factor, sigma-70 family/RNA polymerase sigma-70 factor, Bacteroides expansion family 1